MYLKAWIPFSLLLRIRTLLMGNPA
jgi:hypothetical protein